MVDRNFGLQAVGLMVSERIFKSLSHFKSIETNDSMASIDTRGKFNNASALGRSLYWCQAYHIMIKDRYQSTSARRALALLNSPLEHG